MSEFKENKKKLTDQNRKDKQAEKKKEASPDWKKSFQNENKVFYPKETGEQFSKKPEKKETVKKDKQKAKDHWKQYATEKDNTYQKLYFKENKTEKDTSSKTDDKKKDKLNSGKQVSEANIPEWMRLNNLKRQSQKESQKQQQNAENQKGKSSQQDSSKQQDKKIKEEVPSFVIQDKEKRAVVMEAEKSIKTLIKTERDTQILFNRDSIISESKLEIKKFTKSLESVLKHVERNNQARILKDKGVYKITASTLYKKIEESVDSKKIPEYQNLPDDLIIIQKYIDDQTYKKIEGSLSDYTQNWAELTTKLKTALENNQAKTSDITKEVKNVLKNVSPDSGLDVVKTANLIYDRIMANTASKDGYNFGKELLKSIDNSSFLIVSHQSDNVSARFVEKTTPGELKEILNSPEGQSFLFKIYESLTISNIYRSEHEVQMERKLLKAFASNQDFNESMQILNKAYTKVFPFSSSFLSDSYISAKLTSDNQIHVKMPHHVTGSYEEARRLPNDLFTKGLILKPNEIVGIKNFDKYGETYYVPALKLLDLHRDSDSAIQSHATEVSVYAATAFLSPILAEYSAAAEVGAAAKSAQEISRGKRIIDWSLKAVSEGFLIADKTANIIDILGVVVKENRNWFANCFGEQGKNFVNVVEKAQSLATYYGLARLSSIPVSISLKSAWQKCKNSPEAKSLKGSDLEYMSKMDDFMDNLRKGEDIPVNAAKKRSSAQGRMILDAHIAKDSISFDKEKCVAILRELEVKHSIMKELKLDENAVERIISKSTADQRKGQLLEEFISVKIKELIKTDEGLKTLGLERIKGKVEFIDGYRISHPDGGRQYTDGIIGVKEGDTFKILAVVEAKSGKASSTGLKSYSESVKKMSMENKRELVKEMRMDPNVSDLIEGFLKKKHPDSANLFSKPNFEVKVPEKVIQSIISNRKIREKHARIVLSEVGGQIRKDVERFNDSIVIDRHINGTGTNIKAHLSPTGTRFIGVLPKDVDGSKIEKALRELHYRFKSDNLDVSQKELINITKELYTSVKIPN